MSRRPLCDHGALGSVRRNEGRGPRGRTVVRRPVVLDVDADDDADKLDHATREGVQVEQVGCS